LEELTDWMRMSAEADIKALEQDHSHKLTASEMQEYLGRDFYAYEKALADRDWIEPRSVLDALSNRLVDETETLLREVRLALNAGRIKVGTENKKETEIRRAYIDRALYLASQWEAEIGGDGIAPTGREQYAHMFVNASDGDPGDSYYDVYRALESTPVYRLVKAEDYEPNRFSTVNAIQRQYLTELLHRDDPQATPEDQVERFNAFKDRARKLGLT